MKIKDLFNKSFLVRKVNKVLRKTKAINKGNLTQLSVTKKVIERMKRYHILSSLAHGSTEINICQILLSGV